MRARLVVTAAVALLLTACSSEPRVQELPLPAPSTSSPAAPEQEPRLVGDGIDLPNGVVVFGTPFDEARPALTLGGLGQPEDSGEGSSIDGEVTCPGTRLRTLSFADGALVVLFGDVDGPELTMYQWALTDEGDRSDLPRATALVGDTATFELGVGTTVRELREGAGDAAVAVSPGDAVFPASFNLEDQSSGFSGFLTGTADDDTVTRVQGGQGCGQ